MGFLLKYKKYFDIFSKSDKIDMIRVMDVVVMNKELRVGIDVGSTTV